MANIRLATSDIVFSFPCKRSTYYCDGSGRRKSLLIRLFGVLLEGS